MARKRAAGGGKSRRSLKGRMPTTGDGPVAVQFSAADLGVPGTSAVEVGYRASYAVFVEGNDRAKHVNGQAHFLGQPAASLSQAMAIEAQQAIAEGASRREALLDAGDLLLGASQAVGCQRASPCRCGLRHSLRRLRSRGSIEAPSYRTGEVP
jgi:hypothetical protein